MIILDRPYVSDFLKETIKRNNFPVLKTDLAIELLGGTDYNLIEAEEVIAKVRNNESPRVYTPSENTIHWISKNLDFTEMPEKISYFKNKVRFREMVSGMYPNFFFKEVALKDLAELDVNGFPFPFIIKPSVGFFSMGVYKVHNLEDWNGVLHRIENDMDEVKSLYPTEVMDANSFIIEEMIEGDEYAFDTYFNDKGEPVIVGILQHIFGSDSDVSDRVYFTSKEVIEKNLKRFTEFITKVGELAGLRNFPMHTEVRVTDKGEIIPIEVNPMRFGGWSTSADLTYHAFKINAIEYYLN
ncbi:MAG: ATP-grasp domain-containing protein, partial [Bacteroidota bacterium]|nr:ATP-grasp domain-containing protein [Bacteroidota bacterium]